MTRNSFVPECDSTNRLARSVLLPDGETGDWVAARVQTAGRGRGAHTWLSPEGNLYASFLVRAVPARMISWISMGLGILVRRELDKLDKQQGRVRLKWPNDLVVGDAKLGGILCESAVSGGSYDVIGGVGLNLKIAPALAERATVCLADLLEMKQPSADKLVTLLSQAIAREFSDLSEPLEIISRWRTEFLEYSRFAYGDPLTWRSGERQYQGVFSGLNLDGALSVELPNGETKFLYSEDVELLRGC